MCHKFQFRVETHNNTSRKPIVFFFKKRSPVKKKYDRKINKINALLGSLGWRTGDLVGGFLSRMSPTMMWEVWEDLERES